MVAVLVAIDTVYKQMVAIPLEKKGNRDPFASRKSGRICTMRRTSQSDHPRRLGARTHGSHPRRTRIADSRNTTNLTCEQQGLKMARTLRLDLLSRTNIAVGSDLPITSWMVRHAALLLSHFQTRQFERPYESPVLPFAERVMCKDPTLQPAKLKNSWGYGLWLGKSQTSNAHLIGTRVGIVMARTIRRL